MTGKKYVNLSANYGEAVPVLDRRQCHSTHSEGQYRQYYDSAIIVCHSVLINDSNILFVTTNMKNKY